MNLQQLRKETPIPLREVPPFVPGGASLRTVQRWAESGLLPVFRIARGRRMTTVQAVERLLQSELEG